MCVQTITQSILAWNLISIFKFQKLNNKSGERMITTVKKNITNYLGDYKKFPVNDFLSFPSVNSETHTMSAAIDLFCYQKIPIKNLEKLIKDGYSIDIIGVFPEIFRSSFDIFGYKNVTEISFVNNQRVKFYNYMRPLFFAGITSDNQYKKIIVAVPPGRDYLKHYSSILRHFVLHHGWNLNLITVKRSLNYEKNITSCTRLDSKFIYKDDIVLLGYIEEIELNIKGNMILVSEEYNEYYGSKRYKVGDNIVNFLGVKYSYWGDISRKIVETIIELGAIEIIYAAKLGTLVTHKDIYRKIYSPTRYIILNYLEIEAGEFQLRNKLVERFPKLDSRLHCSVPTILEQNYHFRNLLSKFNAFSVDNEISQMAEAVFLYNVNRKKEISFFAIHFPTDYIRSTNEKDLNTTFDLSNNRTTASKNLKRDIISQISNYLYQYLSS